MGFAVSVLWRAPEVDAVTRKARSIPVLNPVDVYGRVFFFSWLGFMVSFWAWYAFPPLVTVAVKGDLDLSAAQVANANVVSLCATLCLRFVAGPLCDQFGPRRVYAGLMLLGCLPVGLAPLVRSADGLYASRFFIGILGATFVPCQVWCTSFFDRTVVGTANALAGGWGNAGGGTAYFIMPAVFDSLVSHQGMSASQAWRVSFVVPLVCLAAVGLSMLVLCPDTPVGSWHERASVAGAPGNAPLGEKKGDSSDGDEDGAFRGLGPRHTSTGSGLDLAVEPGLRGAMAVIFSPQTLFHVSTYSCSLGGELAINSVLGAYLEANFPHLGQAKASTYAAVFGFLNVVTRPLGGAVADGLYSDRWGRNLWLKKAWITSCGVVAGTLLVVVGQTDPSEHNGGGIGTMMALVALAAVFLEAGNGANFALVPHVHASANGILSGLTGGGGNLGGVVFSIVFRLTDHGRGYGTACWIIGAIGIAVNLAVCWTPPLPRPRRKRGCSWRAPTC